MTTSALADDLKRDEGFSPHAYPDPFSPLGRELAKPLTKRVAGWAKLPGDPWSVGYGFTGPSIGPTTVITQAQADAELQKRIQQTEAQLDKSLPWWRQLSDIRQDVFVEMVYNLGWPKFSKFKDFLSLVDQARFDQAADDLIMSAVAHQLPARYKRLAALMRTGKRP